MFTNAANRSAKFPRNLLTILVAASVPVAAAAPAMAGSHSSTMAVSAVVENNCNVAASPMTFNGGPVSAVSSVDGSAAISVYCTSSAAFTVDMDKGVNAFGDQRRMINENGEYLDYEIFSDASRSQPWGASGQGVSEETAGANGKEIIAYGRINAVTKDTRSGIYRDTITVTVSF